MRRWIDASIITALALVAGVVAAFNPDTFLGAALGLFWWALFSLILYRIAQRTLSARWMFTVFSAGLLLRVPMVLLHLVVGFLVYGGQIDFSVYFSTGASFGQKILEGDYDFFNLPLTNPTELGWALQDRLLALSYLIMGPSLIGMLLLSGLFGLLGSYLFLRGFQAIFPAVYESRLLSLALFLFPSLAFWTSLLGKDSLVYMSLGWATYAVANLLKQTRPQHLLGFALSAALISAFRPPIGTALVASACAAFLVDLPSRFRSTGAAAVLRPIGYLLAVVLIGGVLTMSTWLVRRFEVVSQADSLVEGVLMLIVYKHVGLSLDPNAAGSSLPIEITDPSLTQVLQFLPKGFFTALFRPFLFEAHNAVALIAGLEGTLLLLIVLARARHLLRAVLSAFRSPFVMFCLVAFVLFTVAVSFEANFGVIVRHRTMALPFLFVLLCVPLRRSASEVR